MLRFSCAQDVLQSLQLGRARPAAPIPSFLAEMPSIALLVTMRLPEREVVGLGHCGQSYSTAGRRFSDSQLFQAEASSSASSRTDKGCGLRVADMFSLRRHSGARFT